MAKKEREEDVKEPSMAAEKEHNPNVGLYEAAEQEAKKRHLSEDEVRKIVHDHMSKIGRKGRATFVKNLISNYLNEEEEREAAEK